MWPELPSTSWAGTLASVHQWIQIVGKVRMTKAPWQNHSWHTTLYVTPTGFSTNTIPNGDRAFRIDFDFLNHTLVVACSNAGRKSFALKPMSVAAFYKAVFGLLSDMGIEASIHGAPNEVDPAIPFVENTADGEYDGAAIFALWQAMIRIDTVFHEFRSEFSGKCSPSHLFWGGFDLAITRFSGRTAPPHSGGMPNMPLNVMQEAYSHEVSSAGFWPGSTDYPDPIFYAYCYPTPEDYAQQKVLPKAASYSEPLGEFVLRYEDIRGAKNPDELLLSFLKTTHAAAENTGDWDQKKLNVSPDARWDR